MKSNIEEALELLSGNWKIEPIIRDFILGRKTNVSDFSIKINDVIFHIPYLADDDGYVLWKCYWPDCHNCCNRQGRLPLTSSDLITISKNLKYDKISDFVKKETNIATWEEKGPTGNPVVMTMINLKRKEDEKESEDGTHIRCRFLDEKGYCGLHPSSPLSARHGAAAKKNDRSILQSEPARGKRRSPMSRPRARHRFFPRCCRPRTHDPPRVRKRAPRRAVTIAPARRVRRAALEEDR